MLGQCLNKLCRVVSDLAFFVGNRIVYIHERISSKKYFINGLTQTVSRLCPQTRERL